MSTAAVTPQGPITADQYIPIDAKISALAKLLSGMTEPDNISGPQAGPRVPLASPATVTPTPAPQAAPVQPAPQVAQVQPKPMSPAQGMQSMIPQPGNLDVMRSMRTTDLNPPNVLPYPSSLIPGMTKPGNIDINNRPIVRNADGSRSTLYSYGIEDGGKQMLIPGVSDDGNPRRMTGPEATAEYRRTGQNLGTYDTEANSDAAGQRIHEVAANTPFGNGGGFKPTLKIADASPAAGMETAALAGTPQAKVAPTMNPLPTAPTMPNNTAALARGAGYSATLAQQAPTRDDNKPKWYDRLFGGMATFGAAMQHNPNAVAIGQGIVSNRYDKATTEFQNKQQAARAGLSSVDREIAQNHASYGDQRESFNDQLSLHNARRADETATANNLKHVAEAGYKDYKSMDAAARAKELPEFEKAIGSPLSPDQRMYWIANGSLKDPTGRPANETVQSNLFSDDPKTKAEAQRYFEMEHREPRGPRDPQTKPMTQQQMAAQNNLKNKAITGARTQFMSDLQSANRNTKLSDDERGKHVASAKENYLGTWQQAQDDFEANTNTQQHIDIRSSVDPNTLEFRGGKGNAPAAPQQQNAPAGKGKQLDHDTAANLLREAGGDKAKARQLATKRGFKF